MSLRGTATAAAICAAFLCACGHGDAPEPGEEPWSLGRADGFDGGTCVPSAAWEEPVYCDAAALGSDAAEIADCIAEPDDAPGEEPACTELTSTRQESSPVQRAGSGLPDGVEELSWSRPARYTYLGAFAGVAGRPASHEGVDYVHDDPAVETVEVAAAADGVVVYVRLGCPQSSTFAHNGALRECGAGWGNHVVVDHGGGVHTRYAHLAPGRTVARVGDRVSRGARLGVMGNSGRSELRHLHFELGTFEGSFDPCAAAQSMDRVFDSELLY